jgi:tetraacyldisaccharide 4'-kinase
MINSPVARRLLYLPVKLYELGVRTRIALYETGYLKPARLRTPVVSIGNLTVGGTGKTPFAIWLARYLENEGYHPAILSRGYRRNSRGIIEVSNTTEVLATPGDAGDEPYLMAHACPGVRVVAGENRAAAGKWLEDRFELSALILDDGFQHLGLERVLNFALIDATNPTGDDAIVPLGRLREPLTSLRRADAVVVTRADRAFDQNAVEEMTERYCPKGVPVFYAYHDMTDLIRLDSEGQMRPGDLGHQPVAALSGVARPEIFLEDLRHYGAHIVLHREFRDHHKYSDQEFRSFANDAVDAGAQLIVTTEKDAINLSSKAVLLSALPVYASRIAFRCEDEAALRSLILRAIIGAERDRGCRTTSTSLSGT